MNEGFTHCKVLGHLNFLGLTARHGGTFLTEDVTISFHSSDGWCCSLCFSKSFAGKTISHLSHWIGSWLVVVVEDPADADGDVALEEADAAGDRDAADDATLDEANAVDLVVDLVEWCRFRCIFRVEF